MKFLESEIRKGEVFLFNRRTDQPDAEWEKQFTTLRRGSVALDIHGNKLPSDYMCPCFISRAEFERYDAAWGRELSKIRRGI